jgi:hypothetical protein
MFQTTLIGLLCYPCLPSISCVMNVADIYRSHIVITTYENLITFLSLVLSYSSMYNLSMLSLYSFRHTPMAFTINNSLLQSECFLATFDG